MKSWILGFFFVSYLGFGSCSFENDVRKTIMADYDKNSLPSKPVNVSIRYTALHFDINEENQSMDIDFWISYEWTDPKVRWSTKKYPEVRSLTFHPDDIWTPDIFLYNNAESSKMETYTKTKASAQPDGKLVWIPPVHIKSMCVIDMTYWPHDIHNCTAKFGSWIHSAATINLFIRDTTLLFEEVTMNHENKDLTRGEWTILGSKVVRNSMLYACCPEEYVNIQVSLVVQRTAPALRWVIQLPVIMLSIMSLVIFILPPSSGEKIVFGGICMALHFVFLLSMSRVIGHATNNTPLLVELVAKQLVLTCISVIVSAFILRMIRNPHFSGLPRCIRVLVSLLSTCLCLGSYKEMTISKSSYPHPRKAEDVELNENGNARTFFPNPVKNADSEWILLAAVIDRIVCILFVLVLVIHVCYYSSVL